MMGNVPSCAGSHAAAILGGAVSRCRSAGECGRGATRGNYSRASGRRVRLLARKDAIAETVVDPEYFVVSKSGIERNLGDQIRRRVEGIVGGGVIAVAGAGFSEQEVRRVSVCCRSGLGGFYCKRDGYFVAEALGHANSVLAGKDEADVIRRIDRLRTSIVAT